MFIFLSKFLPLWIYPLGLACLLLLISVLVLLSQPKLEWRTIIVVMLLSLSLSALFLGGNGWFAKQLTRSLEQQYVDYTSPTTLPTADAIVVLGGATRSPLPPRSFPEVNEAGDRLLQALQLYKLGKAPVIILSGGRIQWGGSSQTDGLEAGSEALDMADLLTEMGIPDQALILEPQALNTYQNAIE
ncbi:MAG: YdcF family protein, partial [Cyanobacteria bacterium P01_H01_bin.121]